MEAAVHFWSITEEINNMNFLILKYFKVCMLHYPLLSESEIEENAFNSTSSEMEAFAILIILLRLSNSIEQII